VYLESALARKVLSTESSKLTHSVFRNLLTNLSSWETYRVPNLPVRMFYLCLSDCVVVTESVHIRRRYPADDVSVVSSYEIYFLFNYSMLQE